jgi:glycosyltransferase involved in cell wall biosynthesis
MRIVHFTDYYQEPIGYQDPNLAKAHVRLGHEVHVLTSDRYFPFPNFNQIFGKILGTRIQKPGLFYEQGVTIHRLPVFFEYPASAFIILRGIKKKLQMINPDLVISHGLFNWGGLIVARNKEKLKYKLIYDNHGAAFNTNLYHPFFKRIYLKFWQKFIKPQLLNQADLIVAIGEEERALASTALQIDKSLIKIIPLGADTNLFKPDPQLRAQKRKTLKVKDQEILLVYAGKITRNKNVDLLIELIHNLQPQFNQLKALIIGQGDPQYLAEIKTKLIQYQITDKIIWQNFISNRDLPAFFNAADFGIWPGNPSNVIHEALASGLPLIINNHPSITPLIKNQHLHINQKRVNTNGFILDQQNLKLLTEKVIFLIQNPEIRIQMGQISRDQALKNFCWQKIAQEFLIV